MLNYNALPNNVFQGYPQEPSYNQQQNYPQHVNNNHQMNYNQWDMNQQFPSNQFHNFSQQQQQ